MISEFFLKKTLRIFPFISPACPNGLFGQDCSEKCSGTCSGCNHVSGVCDSGCNPGWMGHSCNQSIVNNISLNVDKTRYIDTLYQCCLQVTNYISGKRHECFSKINVYQLHNMNENSCLIVFSSEVLLPPLFAFYFGNYKYFFAEINFINY